MTSRMAEAARAFSTIADHLTETRRAELAEKIAGLIDSSITPTRLASEPRQPVVHDPDPERMKFDETAQFLADHGYSSGDQVRAAGRLEGFLKKHPNLTREAGMRVWLAQDGAGA